MVGCEHSQFIQLPSKCPSGSVGAAYSGKKELLELCSIMGYFSKEFYFRIIRRGGLLRKFNSSNNMKPTINSNRIVRSRGTTRECGCHVIALLFQDFQQISRIPMVHLILNTVPPEVIKAVNKIVKQASDKGGTLKAQQRKYCFSSAKQCFFKFQCGGRDLLVDMMLLHCSQSPSWIGAR